MGLKPPPTLARGYCGLNTGPSIYGERLTSVTV